MPGFNFRLSPKPMTISLYAMRCLETTSEKWSDEPYVLVTAADLRGPTPKVEVTRYGPFSDVDQWEERVTFVAPPGMPPELIQPLKTLFVVRTPFWGVDNETPQLIKNKDDAIIVASMVENDDGDVAAMRTLVKTAATASLAASIGLDRAERVEKLIADINGALQIPTGAPNFDDPIGTKEVPVTSKELLRALTGPYHTNLYFVGDGGHYRLTLEYIAH